MERVCGPGAYNKTCADNAGDLLGPEAGTESRVS